MERRTSGARRSHLQLLAAPAADQQPPAAHGVATEVANALAAATETTEATARAPLALPLALSVCMARHGVDADGLVDTLQALRIAVLHVAGMDRGSEPAPLPTGEPRDAALLMADYLVGLLRRAVTASGATPDRLASAAAAHLAA